MVEKPTVRLLGEVLEGNTPQMVTFSGFVSLLQETFLFNTSFSKLK